ncbi:hypothetical protein [Ottowia sp.]|uniref:hypothetical protein n=1 Tax=Ottowia sp. TaxID=1898956 RepID=UPI002C6DDA37|nr:hypothetical protein [Ottowia sp.]HRN76659.1 hypothetical protein [Ottowia sp.]HRQ03605.1 hypothetical protein [Ottowia sp.]
MSTAAVERATERVVIMTTETDKQVFVRRAREYGVSVGELVRTAVKAYQPAAEPDASLARLAHQAERAGSQLLKELDEAQAHHEAVFDEIAAIRADAARQIAAIRGGA